MRISAWIGSLALVALAGCDTPPAAERQAAPAAPAETEGGETTAASLETRLAGTQLNLQSQNGEAPPMVMRLNADGTSETAMAGIVLTARWQAEDGTLCQTDVRLGGMPSDDTAPQCVEASVSGDRITLVGRSDDGAPEVYSGTITPL